MKVKVRELDYEGFQKYGTFADMLNPVGPHIGTTPCAFYRDMEILELNYALAGFSVTKVSERPLLIEELEYHNHSGEAVLPLDGDVFMQVAPASLPGKPDSREIEVFRVKQGTLAVLRPGVWHGGPFSADSRDVNILVVLPERTYANDCMIEKIEAVEIEA